MIENANSRASDLRNPEDMRMIDFYFYFYYFSRYSVIKDIPIERIWRSCLSLLHFQIAFIKHVGVSRSHDQPRLSSGGVSIV